MKRPMQVILTLCLCLTLMACATAQLRVNAPVKYSVGGTDYYCVLRQSAGPFGATLEVMDLHDKDGKLIGSATSSNPGMAQNIPGMVSQIVSAGIQATTPAAIAFGLNK